MPSTLLPPTRTIEPFSKRWQDTCRAAITLYCDLPENRSGDKAMRMTRLRDAIMNDFDEWNRAKRKRDQALGRTDLEHWIKGKNYLSDFKFQYVDRWIRTFRNTESFRDVLETWRSSKKHHTAHYC